jgi:hypothetical protein
MSIEALTQRIESLLDTSGASGVKTSMLSQWLPWKDLLSVCSGKSGLPESIRSEWGMPDFHRDVGPYSPQFAPKVRIVRSGGRWYSAYYALERQISGQGAVLAQIGTGWTLAVWKSVNYDIPNTDHRFITVEFGPFGEDQAQMYKIQLKRDGESSSLKYPLEKVTPTVLFKYVLNHHPGFQMFPRKGGLKQQEVWTLLWGIVHCTLLVANDSEYRQIDDADLDEVIEGLTTV